MAGRAMKNTSYEGKTLRSHLTRLLTGCVTLGESSNLSVLQFPLPCDGQDIGTFGDGNTERVNLMLGQCPV